MHFTIKANDVKNIGKFHLQQQFNLSLQSGKSISWITKASPISPTTTIRWMRQDMSPADQTKRQIHPRRSSILTEEEEKQVISKAKEIRASHHPITIEVTRQVILEVTNNRVQYSNSSISRFWAKHGWPNRKVQERNKKELRDTLLEEVEKFRTEVMAYVKNNNIPVDRIYAMDETGLWNGSVVSRTYCDPTTLDSSVLAEGDHKRDTGVVAISASGEVFPHFIYHLPQRTCLINRERVVVQKGVSGMGMVQMRRWVKEFGTTHYNEKGSVLLMDRLKAHENKQVIQELEDTYKFKVFLFPPQGARYASVCDNSFFHSLKARMRKMDTSTSVKKEEAFRIICQEFEPSIIKEFWSHCGWKWEEED